jgi:hypothetical protein
MTDDNNIHVCNLYGFGCARLCPQKTRLLQSIGNIGVTSLQVCTVRAFASYLRRNLTRPTGPISWGNEMLNQIHDTLRRAHRQLRDSSASRITRLKVFGVVVAGGGARRCAPSALDY